MIPEAWRRGEVAVIGLGRSGTAAARWLAAQGIDVYASDAGDAASVQAAAAALAALPGVTTEAGRHDLERIRRAAAVVVSPGVPAAAPPVAAARAAGIEVVAELDLAARALEGAHLIVVTGTNGKTTTTALVAHLLEAGGRRSAAAGNIGRPLIELAGLPERPEWIAVEASSYQLHDAPHLAPAVGILTNLAPDHLDRYGTLAAYYADKRLLFRNADDRSVWVLNADDPAVLELAAGARGVRRLFSVTRRADAWYDRGADRLMLGDARLLDRSALPLLGDHNVANALAAALAAAAAGVARPALADALCRFRSPPHRLEPVADVAGVVWINDSKATNVASARTAVASMTRPFVLLVGGRAKGEEYGLLRDGLDERCRAVVAYGEAGPDLAAALAGGPPLVVIGPFDEAVRAAADRARPGDALLLAPACASFDQFANFEERGERFRRLAAAG